jgi:hypothetical protein
LYLGFFWKPGNGREQLDPGAERKTKLAQMILRQVRQDRFIDAIIAKRSLKAFETLVPQQSPQVHNSVPTAEVWAGMLNLCCRWISDFLCRNGEFLAVTHLNALNFAGSA